MARFKQEWNKLSILQRYLFGVAVFAFINVIILAIMGIFKVLPFSTTNAISIPMLGIITLSNGINIYNKNKRMAILTLSCAALIFTLCIIGLVGHLSK